MDNHSEKNVASTAGERAAASRAWPALTILLVLLLAVCGVWIGMSGFSGALKNSAFLWLLVATAVIFVWRVGGPFALQLLRGKAAIDKRNYVDMSWRSQWFKRRS